MDQKKGKSLTKRVGEVNAWTSVIERGGSLFSWLKERWLKAIGAAVATGGGTWAALKGWWQTLDSWTALELIVVVGGGTVGMIFFVVFVRAAWPKRGEGRAQEVQADPAPEVSDGLEGLRELRNDFLENLHHVTEGHQPDPSQGDPIGVILLKLRTEYTGHRLIAYLADAIPKKQGCQDVLIPVLLAAIDDAIGQATDPRSYETVPVANRRPEPEKKANGDARRFEALAPEIKAAREAAEGGQVRAVTDIAGLTYELEEMGIQYPRLPNNVNELEPWCFFLSYLERMARNGAIADARLLIFECARRHPELGLGSERTGPTPGKAR